MKKCPQKLLIIGPQLFFYTGPAAQTTQKHKSHTTKSPLMQDWVFRLGMKVILIFVCFKLRNTRLIVFLYDMN